MRALQDQVRTIQLLLEADVLGALRYVNGLSPYRFTGLYVFQSGEARNWYLVDRDDQDLDPSLLNISLANTYCAFVKEQASPFVVANAMTDERLMQHPSRAAVRSYCGAPLLDGFGLPVGSICHFDFEPVSQPLVASHHADLLEAVGPLFSQELASRPK